MKACISKALEGSIRKWARIVKSPKELDEGANNCPLCELLSGFANTEHECKVCPVSLAVDDVLCQSTPYISWKRHFLDDHKILLTSIHRVPRCKKCLDLAREELVFLKSLRESK